MNTWILTILTGITWAGPGMIFKNEFPSEESCYRALKEMKATGGAMVESGKKRDLVAYCAPKGVQK